MPSLEEDDLDGVMSEFFPRSVAARAHITGIPKPFEVQVEERTLQGSGLKDDDTPLRPDTIGDEGPKAPKPTVNSVTPNTGSEDGHTNVIIRGDNFLQAARVKFGGTLELPGGTWTSPQRIDAVTPQHEPGVVDVDVINLDGPPEVKGTLVRGYTYGARPGVTNVSPNNGAIAGGSAIEIRGANFAVGCQVKLGVDICLNVVVVDSTYITCVTPPYSGGVPPGFHVVDVIVNNDPLNTTGEFEGRKVNAWNYYAAPTISSVSPVSGPGTGMTSVIVMGNYFLFESGYNVDFDGVLATGTIRINVNQLLCATPAHPEGVVDVVVTAPDADHQTGRLVAGYTYTPPGGTGNPGPDYYVISGPSFVLNGVNWMYGVHAVKNGVQFAGYSGFAKITLEAITPGCFVSMAPSLGASIEITNGRGQYAAQAFSPLGESGSYRINVTDVAFPIVRPECIFTIGIYHSPLYP